MVPGEDTEGWHERAGPEPSTLAGWVILLKSHLLFGLQCP
jgi:hypothetical protein